MHKRAAVLFAATLMVVSYGLAKDKTKPTMPAYVLTARTVAVVIDPSAGESVSDPQANQVAQKDVETALLNWGRFERVMGTQTADLIIVVRKGHGRLVDQTIPDPRQNNRAGAINPIDNGISVGAQHGPQPPLSGSSTQDSRPATSPSQTEIGGVDDSFAVYEGRAENPLDAPAAWRYVAKDGLRPHSVPAVAEFRKALAEAEKAAAKNP
jgi:hypothetical protein